MLKLLGFWCRLLDKICTPHLGYNLHKLEDVHRRLSLSEFGKLRVAEGHKFLTDLFERQSDLLFEQIQTLQ